MNKIKCELKVLTTIVIAEDEEMNFILLNEMLSNSNLTIMHAFNGQEAVDLCSSQLQVDLVLMDLRMPIMNGYEATRQIKAIRPTLPIIVQTAYSSEADKAEAFASGCSDFINKPISKDLLIFKINTLLRA